MLNFCTLFNANYLARGLALYYSLEETCPAFHLYVFAFDDESYTYLKNAPLPHLTPISLHDFENPVLLGVKPTRSMAEYCWTCTPFTILYCIDTFQLPSCTYLDADMIFYSNPQVLIEEMGDKSVLISEHRYPKIYDQSWYSGIYCVQFMCFKNDGPGLHVLNWWKDRCAEWCYARSEDGKFGDQKYLDDWTTRFNCVHVMQHLGGGVAPWNLVSYTFYNSGGSIFLSKKKESEKHPLVFFHFHGLKFYTDNKVLLAGPLYEIRLQEKQLFYSPYVKNLLRIAVTVNQRYAGMNANGTSEAAPLSRKIFFQFVKDQLNAFSRYFSAVFNPKNYNFKNHNHLYAINELP